MDAPDTPVNMGLRSSVDLEDVMKAVLPEPSGPRSGWVPACVPAVTRRAYHPAGGCGHEPDKGFVSRVERDETSPSVATLATLFQLLSVPVSSLFEEAGTQAIHLAEAPHVNFGGHDLNERLLTPRSQSRVQVVRSTPEPGSDGAELYTINCDLEVLHVISGKLVVIFSGRTTELSAGSGCTSYLYSGTTVSHRTEVHLYPRCTHRGSTAIEPVAATFGQ